MNDSTVAPAGSDRHEWDRLVWGWHAVFGALAAVTAGLLLFDDRVAMHQRIAGLAVLVAWSGWYAATGARALRHEPDRLGLRYLLVAVPLAAGLFAAHPAGAVMLFMIYPQLWALLTVRWAIAGTAATVGLTSAVMLAWMGPEPGRWRDVLVTAAVSLLLAVALGLWITRVIEQSRRRADLVRELAETRAELAAVSHHSGVVFERARLAREIHDTLAQGLASVLLQLEAAEADLGDRPTAREHLDRARHIVRENLDEARAMVSAGTPPPLRDSSLPIALRQVVERVGPEFAGRVTLTIRGEPRALPANQEVVLLRTAQEALANAGKHAEATRTEVCLEYHPTQVRLRVSDDGRGFDPTGHGGGFGLAGLRDRVRQAGGALELVSAPGAGATLSVELVS